MSCYRFAALAVVASSGLVSTTLGATQDEVRITGYVDYPAAFDGYYDLVGQSAYIQQVTTGGTSGGQMDLVASTAGFEIAYVEIFPQANITDYLTFGYFGVVDTHELTADGRRADQIIDTSIIMALSPGVGIGAKVQDFNTPGYDEATLVNALTGGFDSTEFLAVLDSYGDQDEHFGEIALPQVPVAGSTLDLIAFIGGVDGDEGVKIGELNTSVQRVDIPSAGATALFGLAGLTAARRRR